MAFYQATQRHRNLLMYVKSNYLNFHTQKTQTKAFYFLIQVLAKLFSLVTRLKEAGNPSNDAIIDECILLPSQGTITTKKDIGNRYY